LVVVGGFALDVVVVVVVAVEVAVEVVVVVEVAVVVVVVVAVLVDWESPEAAVDDGSTGAVGLPVVLGSSPGW
jgi:hypothetical protein